MNNRYLNFTNIIFTILLSFFSIFSISYANVPEISISDLIVTKTEENKKHFERSRPAASPG